MGTGSDPKFLAYQSKSFSIEISLSHLKAFSLFPMITLYSPHNLPVFPLRCHPCLEVLGCLGPHKIVLSCERSFLVPTPLPVQKRLFSLLHYHNTSPLSDISYPVITTCLYVGILFSSSFLKDWYLCVYIFVLYMYMCTYVYDLFISLPSYIYTYIWTTQVV